MASSDPFKKLEPDKNFAWYLPDLEKKITPDIRQLLEDYSGVPSADVVQHVHNIRDKAWAIRPYPCTGLGHFLDPMIAKSAAYPTILSRLQRGDSFLDTGCYLGQDLRRFVFDGSPSTHLYGIDIVSHWDLGYEMFRDEDKFSAHFIETDMLHPNAELQKLTKKIDILCITHVLHQWLWEGQVAAAKQINSLVRPGGLVVGFQIGTSGAADKRNHDGGEKFHSWMMQGPESWKEMWELVGKETGTEWRVDVAKLQRWEELGKDPQETTFLPEGAGMFQFVVSKIR